MSYATRYWNSVARLRALSHQDTCIHHLPALLKLAAAVLYLLAVLSRGPYQLDALIFALAALLFAATLGQVPLPYLATKMLVALPFVLFLGLSNVLLLREPVPGGPAWLTLGLVSGVTLLVKSCLALGAVTWLMAVTPEEALLAAGRRLHVPELLLIQLQLTLRYIGVLVEEAEKMYRAYLLKNPRASRIAFKDMGTFTGLLLIRALARAERVYRALRCRGYRMGNS